MLFAQLYCRLYAGKFCCCAAKIKKGGECPPFSKPIYRKFNALLQHLELVHFVGFSIDNMHGACDAGVEGVDGAQDFNRALGIGHRGADKRMLGSTHDALGVPRSEVPGGGHHELEVADLAFFNADPVRKTATGGI